ncbi:MAG: HD domain-containing protein [Actinomycetota bacterium]|nr:HD domain-containing protein [Actinomycetota bacterium]
MGDRHSSGVHLAAVVAAVSVAGDLGLGQPLEHMLRSCALATRMAQDLGANEEDVDATYWVTLFLTAGCIGTSWELSRFFGDDIAFRANMYKLKPSNAAFFGYLFRSAGSGRDPVSKARVRATMLLSGMGELQQSFVAHCAVNAAMADRLGLGERVATGLLQTFAQWDGKGLPKGIGGEELMLSIRIGNLANQVEVVAREQGVEASRRMAKAFAGSQFDPRVCEAWCDRAEELLKGLDEVSSWQDVVAAAPRGQQMLTEQELDDALELLGDFADLKSPWFTGHSRSVSALAAAAARKAGMPEKDVTTLRRAALVHDIGRAGVPNSIWDKPGPLTPSEYERVRLHAYYTERVLHRAGRLAELGAIAASAHERADGTGYPRAVAGTTIPLLGKYLEAADAYQAMTEDRPHRPALSAAAAALELRKGVHEGLFDGPAADAVLAVAGHPVRRKPSAPGGLTPREVEVLVLAARGATTKAIATRLGIAPKTAGNHLERVYAKAGIGSRAEAAMFAMHHGLVGAEVSGP